MTGGEAKTVRLALDAMATRFELVLIGNDAALLRAVGEEATREIQSIERRFSYYSHSSELSVINRVAHTGPVQIAPDLFQLLDLSFRISDRTKGTFDPTVGPLMRCWGFYRGKGHMPDAAELELARSVSGRRHVELDPEQQTVAFDREGVELDLGGIAKGYAIDEAIRVLRENGIEHALVHGGTSTIRALGNAYDGTPWRVAISDVGTMLGSVVLSDRSLSVSAPSGKSFTHDGIRLGHVMDPRIGQPSAGAAAAAVTCSTATESDALSTAALVLADEANILVDEATGVAVWAQSARTNALICQNLPGFSPEIGQNNTSA